MMSRRRTRQELRASLYGWLKWVPILAMPFAVAVQEVFYSTQVIINDYHGLEITQESRELQRELEALRVEQAQLEALDRLDGQAPNLGLVRPDPRQMRTIYYDERTSEVRLMDEEPHIRHAAAPTPEAAPAANPAAPVPGPDAPQGAPAVQERLATMAAPSGAEGAATLDESADHLLGVL